MTAKEHLHQLVSRFQVRWATPAAQDLEHFDRDTQERIIRAVEHFAETGPGGRTSERLERNRLPDR